MATLAIWIVPSFTLVKVQTQASPLATGMLDGLTVSTAGVEPLSHVALWATQPAGMLTSVTL